MIIIGLTGGLASGKNLVASIFAESGAHIIDADTIAHKLVMPDTPGWEEIIQSFGIEILGRNRTLDRNKLAEIAFHNPQKLEQLCDIIHPKVLSEITDQVQNIKAIDKNALVVVNVPLLIEVGWYEWVDVVVLVTVPYDIQIERLIRRDNLSYEEADRRISIQMSLKEKEEYADYIIDNSTTREETRQQTLEVLTDMKRKFSNQIH
jgi:dephospho-CoA kinase